MLEVAGGILIAVVVLAVGVPLVILCLPYIIMAAVLFALYAFAFLGFFILIFLFDKNGRLLNSEWSTVILFGMPLVICVWCFLSDVSSDAWKRLAGRLASRFGINTALPPRKPDQQ